MRTALVHDYLLVMRGAERTFATIASGWPRAPIFTTLYSEAGTGERFRGRMVETSPLQRLRVGQRSFRRLLPLYPWAVGRLDLTGFELVISSSSAFAHGAGAPPGALHLCYCHSPFRYAWHERETALAEVPGALRPLVRRRLDAIRRWDLDAAARVTRYVANSETTRRRIADCYGRDAAVVHPPVELGRFEPGSGGAYLLVVAELVAHKRVDVALEAARLSGRRIVVVGDGPEGASLRQRFGSVAEFAGRVGDERLAQLYAGAFALVVPNSEEFGIAAVEAQASGCPVVAVAEGGALETVADGRTGILSSEPTAEGLAAAVAALESDRPDPRACREWAERFSAERFLARLREQVELMVAG